MRVYFIVFGSSIATWRCDMSTGKTFADGCSEPFLQKAGLWSPRTLAANHTRPLLSNMPLWLLALCDQIFSVPQYGEGANGLSSAEAWNGGPNDSGTPSFRTDILKNVTLCVFGSRIGMSSLEYSEEP